MASTYTGLGVQLMETGEKAGTWGTLTNTNWNIIEQISGGYVSIACNTTGATTLAVSDVILAINQPTAVLSKYENDNSCNFLNPFSLKLYVTPACIVPASLMNK